MVGSNSNVGIARRSLLWASLAPLLPIASGCASRAPVGPPKPIALLGLLPVLLDLGDKDPGFGTRAVPLPSPTPAPPPPINPTALGMAIGYALRADRDRKQAELASAVMSIGYDPAAALERRLGQALEGRGVPLVRIDAAAAVAVRGGDMRGLPAGVDAWLDVRVTEAGYESSSDAGGFVPKLDIDATLRPAVKGARELDSFSYEVDVRSRPADTRSFTIPATLTFASLDALRASSATVRGGLDALVEQMVERLAQDILRHASGLARLG